MCPFDLLHWSTYNGFAPFQCVARRSHTDTEMHQAGEMTLEEDLVAVSAAAAGTALNMGAIAAAAAPYIMSRRLTASMETPTCRGGLLLALKAYLRTDNIPYCHSTCAYLSCTMSTGCAAHAAYRCSFERSTHLDTLKS